MKLQAKNRIIFSLGLCALIFFSTLRDSAHAASAYKEVEINGLKIHTEEYLISELKLERLPANKKHFRQTAKKINNFYRTGGYVLVKTYLIDETSKKLSVFVDEGRLGRIVFINLNTMQTLRMKYEFGLKYKIYNKDIVAREIKNLRKKYGYEEITEKAVLADEYKEAIIQLDTEFDLPVVGKSSLPFFDKYGYRHNLYLYFSNRSEKEKENGTVDLDIKTSYSRGFIPLIEYARNSLIQNNDMLDTGASTGIRYGYYGLSLNFEKPPEWTFMEAYSNYYLSPMLKKYFTPALRLHLNNSRASRLDLGLLRYNFLVMDGSIAPGITVLKELRIHLGSGYERVYILDPETDPEAGYTAAVNKKTENWTFIEATIADTLLWLPLKKNKRKIEISYRYYKNRSDFHKLKMNGEADLGLGSFSIYSIAADYMKIWRPSPFYHDSSVSDSTFKGFSGDDYYTTSIARNSHEIKTSLYRAFIYGGIFTDLVWFKGSGYDISGGQIGFVSGISGHLILLDQFEFNIYYGKDYIYPEGKSQYNVYMRLHKKW